MKTPGQRLHRRISQIALALSLVAAAATTAVMLRIKMPDRPTREAEKPIPVITLVQIPETRVAPVTTPPPSLSLPLELDLAETLVPDDVFVEHLDQAPVAERSSAPAITGIPGATTDVAAMERSAFEAADVEEPPKRTAAVMPEYPPIAERAGLEGTVQVKVLVNTEGLVDSVTVIDGPAVFHEAAASAARRTRFSPARQNDVPVACWVILPYVFRMPR